MSENVERVRRVYEAMVNGKVEPILEMADPEIEWHNPADALEPGIKQGREEFGRILRGLLETFDYGAIEVEQLVDADDRVAVVVRAHAEGRESGVPVDQRFGHLLDIRDGRIVRFEWFRDPEGAILAAEGRSE